MSLINIKISSYQYRKSHCGDKTILRSSYLNNGISYTGKMISLYWIRALITKRTLPSHRPGGMSQARTQYVAGDDDVSLSAIILCLSIISGHALGLHDWWFSRTNSDNENQIETIQEPFQNIAYLMMYIYIISFPRDQLLVWFWYIKIVSLYTEIMTL